MGDDRPMRRAEKAIGSEASVEEVVRSAQVCHLAMVDDGEPYVVALSFGYEEGILYFHSATAGRKIETLRRNPRVCFQMETDCELVRAPHICGWGMRFRSVIGTGRAEFVEDTAAKREALRIIARHYGGDPDLSEFPDGEVARTAVFCVHVHRMTGKQSGY